MLEHAERELQQLIAEANISPAQLDAIVHRALAQRHDLHDMPELELLLAAPVATEAIEQRRAFQALEPPLDPQPVAEVSPAAIDVPRPRDIDLPPPTDDTLPPSSTRLEVHDTDVGDDPQPAQMSRHTTREVDAALTEKGVPSLALAAAQAVVDQDWAMSTADFAAVSSTSVAQTGVHLPEPADENVSDPSDSAFADSLYTAASRLTSSSEGRPQTSEFDLSETGEHEALGSMLQGEAAPPDPSHDIAGLDDGGLEVLDDEFIEMIDDTGEISELSASGRTDPNDHELAPFEEDAPTTERALPPQTLEELAARVTPAPIAERPPALPKRKTRSSIFRRILGRQDDAEKPGKS